MSAIDMVVLNPPEAKRTYTFTSGAKVELVDVTGLFVSASGIHRLRTADGKLHIVPSGWVHIEIECDGWTL